MNYLVTFSEDDLDLIAEALEVTAQEIEWMPSDSSRKFPRDHAALRRMASELRELKARQDGPQPLHDLLLPELPAEDV